MSWIGKLWGRKAIRTEVFDGEKEIAGLPFVNETTHDNYSLSQRAYTSYLKNSRTLKVIEKQKLWNVGKGLNIQYSPNFNVLERYGIDIKNKESFKSEIEEEFRLFCESKKASLNEKNNVHGLAGLCVQGSKIAGDLLVVLSYIQGEGVKIELIDGYNVISPSNCNENTILGVEFDERNRQIGYYTDSSEKRIDAYDKNGNQVAWMFYGVEGRLSDVRGISRFASVLEQAENIDGLQTAIVTAAKGNAEFYLSFEHGEGSTGADPLKDVASQRIFGVDSSGGDTDAYAVCEKEAKKIRSTSVGSVINLENDSRLKRYDSEGSSSESALFYRYMNDDYISKAGMSSEIVNDKFEGSYSSAKAVFESTKQNFEVERYFGVEGQFYKPLFKYWLQIKMWENQFQDVTDLVTSVEAEEALYKCSFLGMALPTVDPLKEVKAVREALGASFANVPVITLEEAIARLSGRDVDVTIDTLKKELEKTKSIKDEFSTSEGAL